MLDKGVQGGPGTEEWGLRQVPVPRNCDSAGSRCRGQSPVSGQIPVAQAGKRESDRGTAGGRDRGHFLGIPLDLSWDPRREPYEPPGTPLQEAQGVENWDDAEIGGVWWCPRVKEAELGEPGRVTE